MLAKHLLKLFAYNFFLGQIFGFEQPCTINKCGINGNCIIQKGTETCVCHTGFVGTICQFIDPCISKPCGTRGTCFPILINLTGKEEAFEYCQCYAGYSGARCETGELKLQQFINIFQ